MNESNKKLDAILEKYTQVNDKLAAIVNSIISELALDPENDLLSRLGQNIIDARLLLAGINNQIVNIVAPSDKAYLKKVQEIMGKVQKENNQYSTEIENACTNTYNVR